MADPIALGAKAVDVRDKSCCCDEDFDIASVPQSVCRVFGGEDKRASAADAVM